VLSPLAWHTVTCCHPGTLFGLEMGFSLLPNILAALLPTSARQLTLLRDTVFCTTRAELTCTAPEHFKGGQQQGKSCLFFSNRLHAVGSAQSQGCFIPFLCCKSVCLHTLPKTNALSSVFVASAKALTVKDLHSLKQAESKLLDTNLQLSNRSASGASLVGGGGGEFSLGGDGSALPFTQTGEPHGLTLIVHSAGQETVISVEDLEFLCVYFVV